MENNSIFKNPSSQDIIFIEDLISNYHLEDICLEDLDEKDRKVIQSAENSEQRAAFKSLFEEYFPYTEKLWETIFLLINQKITSDQLTQTIQEKTNLPQETCVLLSQDILNNPTIQQEITAIQIEEDITNPEEAYRESDIESYKEDVDEEFVNKIEDEISKENNDNDFPKKGGGLGQELL